MIRINLLPFREEAKKANIRNQVLVYFIFTILYCGGLLWFHLYLNGQIELFKNKIDFTKKEIVKYNKIVEQVKDFRAKLDILKKKLDIIKNLELERKSAYNLLNKMTQMVVEKRMWFSYFESMEKVTTTQKQVGKKTTVSETIIKINIKIEGIALDEKTISDFMVRLQTAKNQDDSEMFKNVKLVQIKQEVFSQDKESPDIFLKNFTITCERAPLAKPDDKKTKTG